MEISRPRYLDRLIRLRFKGGVKIITGMRRSGKSYLLFNLFKDYLLSIDVPDRNIICIALDSVENAHLRDAVALYEQVSSLITDDSEYYILLDEIQLVEGFEEVVNSLKRRRNVDVYITGSNSKFLSSDIVTEFRGRGTEINVRPLSFSEYLPYSGKDERTAWYDYLTYGGLPESIDLETEDRMAYLSELIDVVYMRDIIERKRIRMPDVMDSVFSVLSSAIGSLTNPNRLTDTLRSHHVDVAGTTVSEYIDHLKDSFLFEESKRFDLKGRAYFDTPSKYYATDLGLRNAKLGFRQTEFNHLMENAIYNELRYRGYSVDVGIIGFREYIEGKREYRQLEIDFVANKGSERYYIQSAYRIDDDSKRKQEVRPFLKMNDGFRKIIIVDGDAPKTIDEDGVVTMNVIDFMKDPESLNRI